MFVAFLVLAALISLVGGILFIIDTFRVHWGWGLASLLVPFASLVCLFKHWTATKRGFLIGLISIPFSAGAYLTMPKPGAHPIANAKPVINDPFFNAMEKARVAMGKVKDSRLEELPAKRVVAAPVTAPAVASAVVAKPQPTLKERFAANRAAFTELEKDFAELGAKRKALPKRDLKATAAFNLEAKAYADKLAATRSEQEILLELNRTAAK